MASRSPSPRRSKERSSRRSPSRNDSDRYKQRPSKYPSSSMNNRQQSNYHRNQWQPRYSGGGYNNYYQRNRWQGNYRGRGYNRPYNNYHRGNNNYRYNQNHSRYRRSRSRGSRSRSRSRSYSRSRSRGRSYSRSRSRSYSSRSRSRSVSKSNRSRSTSVKSIKSKPGLEALSYFRGNSSSGDSDTGKDGSKATCSPSKIPANSKTDNENTPNKLEVSALASVERHKNNLSEMIKQANTSSFNYQAESENVAAKSKQIKIFSISSSSLTSKSVTKLYSSSDENSSNEAAAEKEKPSSQGRNLEENNQVIEIDDDDDEQQVNENSTKRAYQAADSQLPTSGKNYSAVATASVEPKPEAKEAASAASKLPSSLNDLKIIGPDGKPVSLIAVTVPDADGKMMQVLQIPGQPLASENLRGSSGEKITSASDNMEVDNRADEQIPKEMAEKYRRKKEVQQSWSNEVVAYPGNYMGEDDSGGIGVGDKQGYKYTSNAPDYNESGTGNSQYPFEMKKADKIYSSPEDVFTDSKYEAATPASQKLLSEPKPVKSDSDEKKAAVSTLLVQKENTADEDTYENEDYLDLGKGKKKKKKSKKNKRATSTDGGGGKDKKKKKKKKSKKSAGEGGEALTDYEEFKLKRLQNPRREDGLNRDLPADLPISHIRGILARKGDEGKMSLFNHVPSLDKKKPKEAAQPTVEEQFVSLFSDETDQKEEEAKPEEELDMSLKTLRKLKIHLPTPRKVNHRTEITINVRLENVLMEAHKKKKKSSRQQFVQQVSVNLDGLSKTKKRKISKAKSPSPSPEKFIVVEEDNKSVAGSSQVKRGYRDHVRSSSSEVSISSSPAPDGKRPRSRRSRSKSKSLPQAYKRNDGGNSKDGSDDERYKRGGSGSSRSRSRSRENHHRGGNRMSYNQGYQSRNFYNNNNRFQRGRGYNNNFNNRGNFRGRFNNNYRGGGGYYNNNNNRGGYNNRGGGYYNNNRGGGGGGSYYNSYYNSNNNSRNQNDWRSRRDSNRSNDHERYRSRDNRSRSDSRDRASSVESNTAAKSPIQKSKIVRKEVPAIVLSSPGHPSKEQESVDPSVRFKKMNEPWTHDMYEAEEAEASRD